MDIGFKHGVTKERWITERIHRDCDHLTIVKEDGLWWIFQIVDGEGMPWLRTPLQNKADAVKLAQALYHWYNEYFIIWREWGPYADIPVLTQYTIPNGVKIAQAIAAFKKLEVAHDLDVFRGLI